MDRTTRLVVSAKRGEHVMIGNAKVIVQEFNGNQVRLCIEAPASVQIVRSKAAAKREEESKRAAEVQVAGEVA